MQPILRLIWFSLLAANVLAEGSEGCVKQEVTLRIEGANSTIFEGQIKSCGHNVTTASGGTNRCDGTNNNQNPTPGNTPTATLDTAASQNGFTWDGTFTPQFDDYFVTRIGPDAQTATQFWGILVNYQFIPVGGCQFQTQPGDEILFAFDAFNKENFLKLAPDEPDRVATNTPFTVTVTNGQDGTPIEGATVGGQTTDANGQATLTFSHPGKYVLKAERSDSIRSNAITVHVVGGGYKSKSKSKSRS
ncbi:MAG: hypothetical protein M1823_000776 [Watsoniomyces obsoletus]|nr:MAG: hypothetical protein M1823_000776 [Watsoniomyces obsoletus]